MLKLSKGRPEAMAVPLQGSAVAFVRPATAFEIDMASAAAARMLAGIVEGQEAAAAALEILGDEFRQADFTTRAWLEAAAQRIALLELAVLCVQRIDGVVGDNDEPVSASRETLALLLRDSDAAIKIGAAIRARVHREVAEGNGSAALPNGGAAADEATAPNAGETEAPVPKEGGGKTERAVPK